MGFDALTHRQQQWSAWPIVFLPGTRASHCIAPYWSFYKTRELPAFASLCLETLTLQILSTSKTEVTCPRTEVLERKVQSVTLGKSHM